MPEPVPPREPTEGELERMLPRLERQLAYPPTPPLAVSVRRRLEARAARSRSRRWFQVPARGLAMASLAVVVAMAATLVLAPSWREAVADRLGLRGIGIVFVDEASAPAGSELKLGRPVSLAEANEHALFPIVLPGAPGFETPDAIYLDEPYGNPMVSLVYLPRPDLPAAGTTGVALLISQFRGTTDAPLVGKELAPGTPMTPVLVDGEPGFWIAGPLHTFGYVDPEGIPQPVELRLATNTLIWERDGLTLRLEGNIDERTALNIAESVGVPSAG